LPSKCRFFYTCIVFVPEFNFFIKFIF
jgi:hypothetical protein